MTSSDLTPDQAARLRRTVDAHLDFYLRAFARTQRRGMPADDPLVDALARAWGGLAALSRTLAAIETGQPPGDADALGASWEVLKTLGLGKHGRR